MPCPHNEITIVQRSQRPVSYTHLDVYKRQLLERDMRKEDLRLAAGMTTNMIANMSKEGKHISMDTCLLYTSRCV